METERFLEQFNQPTEKNYGLFQRKSDGKIFEWKEFLELFNNEKTTSQQQTIERLRELIYETNVDEIKSTMFSETIALAGHRYEFVEGAKWMLEYFKKSIELKKLLNTTEPIDQ